ASRGRGRAPWKVDSSARNEVMSLPARGQPSRGSNARCGSLDSDKCRVELLQLPHHARRGELVHARTAGRAHARPQRRIASEREKPAAQFGRVADLDEVAVDTGLD